MVKENGLFICVVRLVTPNVQCVVLVLQTNRSISCVEKMGITTQIVENAMFARTSNRHPKHVAATLIRSVQTAQSAIKTNKRQLNVASKVTQNACLAKHVLQESGFTVTVDKDTR